MPFCFLSRCGKGKLADGDGINLNDIEKVLPAWQVGVGADSTTLPGVPAVAGQVLHLTASLLETAQALVTQQPHDLVSASKSCCGVSRWAS